MNRSEYAELFDKFPRGSSWEPSFKKRGLYEAALKTIKQRRYDRILDAGCGDGYFTNMLVEADIGRVWGLDVSREVLVGAQRSYPCIDFKVGDVRDLDDLYPFSFDLVCCLDTLTYLTPLDLYELFKLLHDKLTANGYVLAVIHTGGDVNFTGLTPYAINEYVKSLLSTSKDFAVLSQVHNRRWRRTIYLIKNRLEE